MFPFIANLGFLIGASLFQLTNYAFINNVKPNLALVLVIFLSLIYNSWLTRLIFIFTAAVIFKFGSGLELGNVLFILASFIGIYIAENLPASFLLNFIVATLVATSLVNLNHYDIGVVLTESVYNVILVLGYYSVYKLWQK